MTQELALPKRELSMTDEEIMSVSTGQMKFLPRIQLCPANSKPVRNKLIPPDHYGLVIRKTQFVDLGEHFVCLPLDARLKAVDMNEQPPLTVYPGDPLFAEIKERSSGKDSGCMWGPEFLVWLPQQKRFAVFMFGNPTARNVAPELFTILKEFRSGAEIGSKLIEGKDGKVWLGPTVAEYGAPIVPLPSEDSVLEQIRVFKAVKNLSPSTSEETVEDAEDSDEDERMR